MAKYYITQKLNLNGQKTSVSFVIVGDDTDVQNVTALLEGGYEVKKVDEALSNMTKSDSLVAETNPVTKIIFIGDKGLVSTLKPFGATKFPSLSSVKIHFKQTANVDDIKTALVACKPFEIAPTEIVKNINVARYE